MDTPCMPPFFPVFLSIQRSNRHRPPVRRLPPRRNRFVNLSSPGPLAPARPVSALFTRLAKTSCAPSTGDIEVEAILRTLTLCLDTISPRYRYYRDAESLLLLLLLHVSNLECLLPQEFFIHLAIVLRETSNQQN